MKKLAIDPMLAPRFAIAAAGAVGFTFALFFFMQRLVAIGEAEIKESVKGRVIDFVRVKRESQVIEKERELPDKPDDLEQPDAPELNMEAPAMSTGDTTLEIAAPTAEIELDLKGPSIGAAPTSDADAAPLVRVEPVYPTRAAAQGIEGWVRIRFDIGTAGQVKNAVVVEAKPPRVFDKAAIRAVRKWKYRPTVKKGVPIEKKGIIVKLTFEL